jgi:biotin carboxylase
MMRVLKVGRPLQSHWRLPLDVRLTVVTDVPASSDQYEIIRVSDLTDVELVLTALHRAGSTNFDVAHTDYEDAIVMTAALAAVLGADVSIDADLAVLARDKYLQKSRVAEAGIPVTDIEPVPMESERRADFRPSFGYPVILKPALGSGTSGLSRADNAGALRRAMLTIPRIPYVCERFVSGEEYHVDAIVQDGVLRFLSVGAYAYNLMEANGSTKMVGSVVHPHTGHEKLYDDCEKMATDVVGALGYRRGSLHMEVFRCDTGLVFSECGLRHGGVKVPEGVGLAAGIDLRELSFLAGIGAELPELVAPRPTRPVGWMLIAAGPGRLESLPSDAELRAFPGMVRASMDYKRIGESLPPPRVVDSVGYCVFTGETVASTRAKFERLQRIVIERTRCSS